MKKVCLQRSLLFIAVLIAGFLVINELSLNLSRIGAAADSFDNAANETSSLTSPLTLGDARVWYRVRGAGNLTINGPACCEGVNFPGTFEMDYRPQAGGRIEISRLQTSIPDMALSFRVLVFETKRMTLQCGELRNDHSILGDVDSSGSLTIFPGAATISGDAFEKRNARGECSGASTHLTATNNRPIRGVLDPAANHVALAGAFTARVEDNDYTLTLDVTGTYANRPPRARFGVSGRNLEAFAQGGCPAILNTGNPPESVVEANDPAGLKMSLRSHSYDPDGAWIRADLDLNKWFYAQEARPLNYLGEGLEYGPMTFGFGPRHRLVLETSDRLGAATTDDCSFRVVDTTAPSVSPPALLSVARTFAGGARVRNSPELQRYLDASTCSDIVDAAPRKLPPLLAGAEVTSVTVFPIGYSTVTFRCRDRFGNIGTAQSRVKVTASK